MFLAEMDILDARAFVAFQPNVLPDADGRQLQRIGLVPDLEVRPTIEGLQNGRDEVLEAAIEYLQREIGVDQ